MSIVAGQVTLGTAATLIFEATNSDKCEITFQSKSKDVFIGESDVTTTNGYRLEAGNHVTLKIGRNDAIYGIVDSSTHTISYWVYVPN
jgi:cold shock CspA family protein